MFELLAPITRTKTCHREILPASRLLNSRTTRSFFYSINQSLPRVRKKTQQQQQQLSTTILINPPRHTVTTLYIYVRHFYMRGLMSARLHPGVIDRARRRSNRRLGIRVISPRIPEKADESRSVGYTINPLAGRPARTHTRISNFRAS